MTFLSLALLPLLTTAPAEAGNEVYRLTWDLSVEGQPAGKRTATVTVEPTETGSARTLEAYTELNAQVGGRALVYRQRLTAFAEDGPAAFHAVIKENGAAREVQGRWTATGWTVTLADKAGSRTFQAAPQRIDLSTADLVDPQRSVSFDGRTTARILSTETGDVWEGTLDSLGNSTITIDGQEIPVSGWAWDAPVGRSEFWWNSEGWLVRYTTNVAGKAVSALLGSPPPRSADAFTVDVPRSGVESVEL